MVHPLLRKILDPRLYQAQITLCVQNNPQNLDDDTPYITEHMKRPSQLFTDFEDSKPETAHEKPLAARVEMVFHHQQFKYIGRNTSRDAAKTGIYPIKRHNKEK